MKKLYFSILAPILAVLLAIGSVTNASAQCSTSHTSGGIYSPSCVSYTTINPANTNSAYRFSVVNGGFYEIRSCSSGFNSMLTLRNTSGTGSYITFSNGGQCSDDAIIYWTANFTGTVAAIVNQDGCNWPSMSSVLAFRSRNPSTASISASYGCTSTTLSRSGGEGSMIWQQSSNNSSFVDIAGATGSSYTVTSVNTNSYFRVRHTAGNCTSYSSSFYVVPRNVSGSHTVTQNTTMAGVYNFSGNFTVNSGVTISTIDNCELEVYATNITMSGTINGNGRGGNGGGGGGGGSAYASCGNESENTYTGGGGGRGAAGGGTGGGSLGASGGSGNGTSRDCGGFLCIGNSDGHFGGGGGGGAAGGGSYGGSGGTGGYGARGGWFASGEDGYGSGGSGGSAGSTYNSTYDVALGSGGGGAGGGGGSRFGGSGGSSGGDGGGSVSLIASDALTLTGLITVDGTNGGSGGNGSTQADGSYDCVTTNCGTCSICFANETFSAHGGAGGGAGGGSGGGIRLQAFGNMSLTGTLSAEGGNGGAAGAPYDNNGSCNVDARSGGGGGGGRIKVIINPCATNNVSPTTDVSGGAGGGGNGTAGANAGSGSYESAITHPSYSAPSAGSITSNQTLCSGGSPAAFTGTAASGGTGSYTYTWYSCTGGGCTTPTNGNAVAGVGWTNRGTNAVGFNDGNALTSTTTYIRGVQSGECYMWSNVVTVTVVADPAITITTASQTICEGGSLTLSSTTLGGTGTCSYQWQYRDGTSGTFINTGSNSSSLATGALSGTRQYQVVRSCSGTGCNTATSNIVTITVVPDPSVTITTPDQSICEGGSLTLSGTASGGTGTCTFQWQYRNGTSGTFVNTGTNSSSLATGALTGTRQYQLVRSCSGNNCGTATSNIVTITVEPDPAATITTPSQTICSGGSLTLSSTAAGGTGTCTFQWQYRNGTSGTFVNTGTNSSSLATGALTGTRQYQVIRSCTGNDCNDGTSNIITITVVNDPSITITTPTQDICNGDSRVLTSSVSGGTGTCSYQWQYGYSTTGPWSNLGTASTQATGTLTQTTYYRVIRSCTGNNCATATSFTMRIGVITDNLWTGAAGSGGIGYWDIPGNWSCGIVPNSTHDVNIPASATNQPVIRDKSTYGVAECKTLSIENGATLNILNTGELQIFD